MLRSVAPPQAPQFPQMSTLDQLFGKGKMGRLQSGMAMIQASQDPGYGGVRPNLATAGAAGMQQGMGYNKQQEALRRQQEIGQMMAAGDVQGAQNRALQYGDLDLAAKIEALKPPRDKSMLVSAGQRVWNPNTGQWDTNAEPKPADWKDSGELNKDQEIIVHRTNPTTGELESMTIPIEVSQEAEKGLDKRRNVIRDDLRSLNKDHGVNEILRFSSNIAAGFETQDAAGDRLIIQGIAKLNDPGSIVRNSEFEVWASISGMTDRIKKAARKIDEGIMLTQDERQILYDVGQRMRSEAVERYDVEHQALMRQAAADGLDTSLFPSAFGVGGGYSEGDAGADRINEIAGKLGL